MIRGIFKGLKRMVGYISVESMSQITKSNLELLIREIQELSPNEQINVLLASWIKGNDLHPERVRIHDGLYYIEDIKEV